MPHSSTSLLRPQSQPSPNPSGQHSQRLALGQHLARVGLLLIATIALLLGSPAPAQAAIHTYAEGHNQVLYRSQHSIRDDRDHTWQAVFFKRQDGDRVTALHLRLVGYPGMGYPSQSRDLTAITGPEKVWEFPNISSQDPNLTENASQFDLSEFIQSESRDLPLKLYLPILNVRHPSVLTVPPFMVEEWHQVASLSPDRLPANLRPQDLQPPDLFPNDRPTPDSRTAERTPNPDADNYPV